MNADNLIHREQSDSIIGAAMVDPKVTENFTPTHQAQMSGYLTVTSLQLALLFNFKFADLRWQRVVRQFPIRVHP